MERLAKHWNGVPGEAVEPPFLEVLNKFTVGLMLV